MIICIDIPSYIYTDIESIENGSIASKLVLNAIKEAKNSNFCTNCKYDEAGKEKVND